jgi:hypothetical protein
VVGEPWRRASSTFRQERRLDGAAVASSHKGPLASRIFETVELWTRIRRRYIVLSSTQEDLSVQIKDAAVA